MHSQKRTLQERQSHCEEEGPRADLVLRHEAGGGGVEVTPQLADQVQVQRRHGELI